VLIGAAWGGFLGLRHLAARASALDAPEKFSLDWRYSLAGPLTPPRHACGYALANRDHDTRAIQGWLGHGSITSTAVYAALASNRFKDYWLK
jgi:hypothetical protein